MRPLSAGASESVRHPTSGGKVVAVVLVVAALVTLGSRLPLPDQDARIGAAYVLRTDDGLEVGLRSCARELVRRVEVRRYLDDRIVWSATAQEDEPSRSSLPLFQQVPGFTVDGAAPTFVNGLYDVSVGPGVVFDAALPRGFVAYPGSDDPVIME